MDKTASAGGLVTLDHMDRPLRFDNRMLSRSALMEEPESLAAELTRYALEPASVGYDSVESSFGSLPGGDPRELLEPETDELGVLRIERAARTGRYLDLPLGKASR